MWIQFLKKEEKNREGTFLLLHYSNREPFFAKYEISVHHLEFHILSVFTERACSYRKPQKLSYYNYKFNKPFCIAPNTACSSHKDSQPIF